MSGTIRIVQFFDLETSDGKTHLYQNYFVKQSKSFGGKEFGFAPFQVQGGVSSLNGDNIQIQVLFPATEYAIKLVEAGKGNRKSLLTLSTRTVFLTEEDGEIKENISKDGPLEIFVGLGASISEDTIELRFNTAADSVAANFPAQRLNEKNVGFLPLDSALSLR